MAVPVEEATNEYAFGAPVVIVALADRRRALKACSSIHLMFMLPSDGLNCFRSSLCFSFSFSSSLQKSKQVAGKGWSKEAERSHWDANRRLAQQMWWVDRKQRRQQQQPLLESFYKLKPIIRSSRGRNVARLKAFFGRLDKHIERKRAADAR